MWGLTAGEFFLAHPGTLKEKPERLRMEDREGGYDAGKACETGTNEGVSSQSQGEQGPQTTG